MSLVFAAITPHPPILIPAIGKDNLKKIDTTKKAMEKLEEDLYLSHPDILLLISPHGKLFPDAFSMNVCSEYETDLKEFGDLTTKLHIKGEMNLPALIREAGKEKDYKTIMISEKNLDHGAAVPLFYLTPHLPNVGLTVFGFSDLDAKTHTDFGYLLKEQILHTNKRVAVIASGDLSHSLKEGSPAGYSPSGKIFDKKFQQFLLENDVYNFINLDQKLVKEANECGLRPTLMLLGAFDKINFNPEILSYQDTLGVGHLVASFIPC